MFSTLRPHPPGAGETLVLGATGAGGDGSEPYFFLSYAHTPKNHPKDKDPNIWVERFYRDLCAHVLQLTSLPAGVPAGFLDQQMQPGEGWQERLSEALANCRVFVPLYSPRYFLSEQCGREWFVFSTRAVHHQARSNSNAVSGIVPALWVPVPAKQLPQPAERLQFNHATFGDDYADEGFYGLIKLRYLRDQYERAVYLLAKRIVSVAEQTRIAQGDPHQDYGAMPSAFGPPGPAREMEVSVLACSQSDLPQDRGPDCYGPRPRDWNPYHPKSSRPLADHAVDLVRNLDYRVRVGEFEADAERLLAADSPQAPGLLLLDRWALDAPHRRELVRRLCAEERPWFSVMIPWNREDPESRQREGELNRVTERSLAPRLEERSGHRTPSGGLPTLEAFSQELPGAVKAADRHYAAHARTYPPQGPSDPIPRVLPSGIGYGAGVPASTARDADQGKGNADKGQVSS
ncbi:FxsC protein [Streptomyces lunaelactis]|uniref:FxsC protein n=1 Tax=Streptomyces lunaelactis TaxID=1535768 RepID=A0A2R4SY68_9ACTN|nr:FxsC protein [Streptomyces lunaelactis]NUK85825.1 TIR domain-containing protein [Streptomyces lunaelactis]